MVIKTFNIDERVYKEFSTHCKKNGVSMSKRVENFIRDEVAKINAYVNMHKERRVAAEKAKTTPVALGTERNGNHSFSKYC